FYSLPLCSPLTSPPFPYTTLFRSLLEPLASGSDRLALSSRPRPGGAQLWFQLRVGGDTRVQLYDVAGRQIETLIDGYRAAGEYEDRKSTRLNSSHVAISYAVFCLK